VAIVTNGTDIWIRKGLQFLPATRAIIEYDPNSADAKARVLVVSARDLFHDDGEEKRYSEWKHNAFNMLCNEHLPSTDGCDIDKIVRIVSFGDGDSEELAMHSLVSENRIITIVKFKSNPTLNELFAQLSFAKDNVRHYLSGTENQTVDLESLLFS